MDREARFSHLLQPIRDLAENWDIDIATGLEDYLEDIEKITISLDGGQTSLNFAEAALLIQGSTCIYSRKVEYLYSLVLQTLEALSSGKYNQAGKEAGGTAEEGHDVASNDDSPDDDFTLGLLENTLEAATNIDLDDDEEDASSPLEDSTLRGATIFLAVEQTDTGTASFKMSSSAIHKSGALLVDGGQSLHASKELENSLGGELTRKAVWFEGTGILQNFEESGAADDHDSSGDDGGNDGPEFVVDAPEELIKKEDSARAALNSAKETRGDVVPMTPSAGGFQIAEQTPGLAYQDVKKAVESAGPMSGIWEMLDPHDPGPQKPRPFRKGKVTMAIPEDMIPDEEDNWVLQAADFDSMMVKLSGLAYREFEYVRAQERRRKGLAQRVLRRQAAEFALIDPENEGGYFSDDEHQEFGDGADFDPYGGDSDDEAQYTGNDVETDGIPPMMLDEVFSAAGKTYEDLCRNHIEAFMSGVEQYAAEGELARRVNEWQNRLGPILQEQDNRAPFDIHQYGGKIINKLASTAPPRVQRSIAEQKIKEIDAALRDSDVCLSFAQVVAGKARHEVCRMFLASLQLANNGNLQLMHGSNATEQDDTKFDLRLKSMKAAYEFISYLEPHTHLQN